MGAGGPTTKIDKTFLESKVFPTICNSGLNSISLSLILRILQTQLTSHLFFFSLRPPKHASLCAKWRNFRWLVKVILCVQSCSWVYSTNLMAPFCDQSCVNYQFSFNQLCRTRQLHLCECKINIIVQTTPISKHYSVDFIDERHEPRMSMMWDTVYHSWPWMNLIDLFKLVSSIWSTLASLVELISVTCLPALYFPARIIDKYKTGTVALVLYRSTNGIVVEFQKCIIFWYRNQGSYLSPF